MNDELKNNPITTNSYWGLCSIISGIFSILLTLGISYFWGTYGWKNWDRFLIGMLLSLVFAITGLGLGVKGLKSNGRIYSKAGITICILGVLLWLYAMYAWLSTDPW
jgi:hypothetical protein